MNKILVKDTSTFIVLPTTTTPPPEILSATLPDGIAGIITENGTSTWTVQTNGITNGTVLTWTIKHTTTDTADFSAVSGTFTITGNTGSFTIAPIADLKTEGPETFTIEITGPGSIAPYTTVINQLNDTSIFTTTTTTTTTSTTTTSTTTTSTSTTTTSTSTTSTTIPPAIIPSVTLTGPTCIDTITPGAVSEFTATFSAPVTGFDSSDIAALSSQFIGLTITGITAVSATEYRINTVVASLPYSIVESGASVMTGTTGLVQLAAYTTTASGNPGDDTTFEINLPFPIAFPTSATSTVSGTRIWVGTNSFIALNPVSPGSGFPPSLTNPACPAIFIGTQDSGMFNLYGGSRDGNQTYTIRWEGVRIFTDGGGLGPINRIWEVTLYADSPSKFRIDIDPTTWESPTQGRSFIKNANTALFPTAAGTNMPIVRGGYIVVDSKYTAQIPAGVALSSTSHPNTASNRLTIIAC
jgi:hypothetical protein